MMVTLIVIIVQLCIEVQSSEGIIDNACLAVHNLSYYSSCMFADFLFASLSNVHISIVSELTF